MYRIEINDAQIMTGLNLLASGMADMTPAMQEIAEFMLETTKNRFPSGVAPDGTPWAPKSPVTLAAYARRGDRQDSRPLFGPTGVLSKDIFGVAAPDSAEIGSPMIYAAVMQFGAAQGQFGARIGKDKLGRDHFHHIPWGDIPARPFLGLSDTDREGVLEIIAEYLDALSQGR